MFMELCLVMYDLINMRVTEYLPFRSIICAIEQHFLDFQGYDRKEISLRFQVSFLKDGELSHIKIITTLMFIGQYVNVIF